MLFSDIPGQEEVKSGLIRSVKDNRISHAQLFSGPEGSCSLAMAVAYAQYICCNDRKTEDSCGMCSSCRKYNKLVHPDLHFSYPFVASKEKKVEVSSDVISTWRESFLANPFMSLEQWMQMLDAENKLPNINIAECHDIIKRLTYKSFESEYKVLIMWLPEYLGNEGNSLLKLIEEPPEKTLFILVSENYDRIINTILSRTQLVKLTKLRDKDICEYLREHFEYDESKAKRIAYLANGNISAALDMTRDDENDLELLFVQWIRLCFSKKGIEITEWIEQISKSGRENQKNLLKMGLQIIRDALILKEELNEIVRFESQQFEIDKFALVLNYANAPLIIRDLEQAAYHIERNANPKILFLDLSIRIMKNLQIKNVNSHLSLI